MNVYTTIYDDDNPTKAHTAIRVDTVQDDDAANPISIGITDERDDVPDNDVNCAQISLSMRGASDLLVALKCALDAAYSNVHAINR